MKTIKKILIVLLLIVISALGYGAWILFGSKTSNPNNYKTIGNIPTPWGYERIKGDDAAYSEFLRSLPLKGRGSDVMLYTGGCSRFQLLNYAVVDIPLLAFERYLRNLYGVASTFSLSREMKTRRLAEMQPGDVFVYAAVDRPGNHKYGHAVMIVDVAENKSGKKTFLLAEGNTPARDIHVMRNFENPFRSPWFFLDDDADVLLLSVFPYKSNELRHF